MVNKFIKHESFNKAKIKLLFELFFTFFKISPFTFGGGFAMIPIIEREVVDKKKWFKSEKLVDVFAVSQSVPGAVGVNSATFIGYQLAGIPGAIASALGIVIPTFIIIIAFAVLFVTYQDNTHVQAAFKGIKPVVTAFIAISAYRMGKNAIRDKMSWFICILSCLLLFIFRNMNIVFLILGGAFTGIAIYQVRSLILKLRARNDENGLEKGSKDSETVVIRKEHALSGEKT